MFEDVDIRYIDDKDSITNELLINGTEGELVEMKECDDSEEDEPAVFNMAEMLTTMQEELDDQRWKVQDDAAFISDEGVSRCMVCSESAESLKYLIEQDIVTDDEE